MPVAPDRGLHGVPRTVAGCAALAGLYFMGGVLGLKLAFDHPSATAVWPPTGIALAGLLLLGPRAWPGVFAGALLVNLTLPGPSWMAGLIAAGNTLEAVVGAWFVRRWCAGATAFEGPGNVFRYAVLAGLVATAVSATIGVVSVCLADAGQWARYGSIWLTWWLGDFGGAMLVAPAILSWATLRPDPAALRRLPEASIILLAVLLSGSLVFGGWGPLSASNFPVAFLVLPALICAALRLGPTGTATASLLLCSVAVWGTLLHRGPFGGWERGASLILLQAFMGVLAVTVLVLAAAVRERQVAEAEVRRALAELRENRERFRLIFESALDAMITMDSAGVITEWNAQARQIFGWTEPEALGRKLAETIIPERLRESHQRGLERFLATGEGPVLDRRLEFDALHRDGREFPVELAITAFRAGGVLQFAGFVRDISDRRRAEREIRDLNRSLSRRVEERTSELQNALKELEGFSYTIAHDLRAPLRAMSGFSQVLVEEYAARLDDRANDYARRIVDAARRMDTLIQELLDYSRLAREEVHLESVDLEDPIAGALAHFSSELSASRAEIMLDRPFPRVKGHAMTLQQAVVNLISNALKFVGPGVAPRIRVRAEIVRDRVRLWVEDNGIGISPEHHDRIFGVFQKLHPVREYPGSGICLAIVRKAIERMGGRAGVESEAGKGSRFWIELSLAETQDAGQLQRPAGRG